MDFIQKFRTLLNFIDENHTVPQFSCLYLLPHERRISEKPQTQPSVEEIVIQHRLWLELFSYIRRFSGLPWAKEKDRPLCESRAYIQDSMAIIATHPSPSNIIIIANYISDYYDRCQ
jgi:hypothetical protein